MITQVFIDGVQLHDTNGIAITKFARGVPSPRGDSSPKPSDHGTTDWARYYDAAVFDLQGEVWGADAATFWANVDALRGAFSLKPDGSLRQLQWTRDGSATGLFSMVRPASDLTMPLDSAAYWAEWGITLVAPDPRIYGTSVTISGGAYNPAGGQGLKFPLTFKLVFAGTGSITVTNNGNFPGPCTYQVSGPVTNPIIENSTTGNALYTSGLVLASGDTVYVDTGARTIKWGATSIPQYVDASLTRWPDLAVGPNTIRLRGTGMVSGQTQLFVSSRDVRI